MFKLKHLPGSFTLYFKLMISKKKKQFLFEIKLIFEKYC